MDSIPLSSPDITQHEIDLVTKVLRSGRLSIGPMTERFEELVAERAGTRYAAACSSGTAGLHMALAALNIGPGDEVITTSFAFVAPANAILYVGATPVFVDICTRSLNMDPAKVEAAITPRTKAIIAVENFGNPEHMEAYRRIADRNEIKLIEDSCEGLGGAHKGRRIGSFGHLSVFGFYPNKQITTGEGGMVCSDNEHLMNVIRSLRNQGRPNSDPTTAGTMGPLSTWMSFERLGYNFRMSEVAAALGVGQMERLDDILEQRERVAQVYMNRLLGNPDLILPSIHEDTAMSWFVFVVRLSDQYSREERDRMIAGLHRHDVGAAAYFPPIHLQPQFLRGRPPEEALGEFPITESLSQRTMALPFHTRLSARDADFVASTLELMLNRENLRRT